MRSVSFPEGILRWRTTKASPPGSAGARPGDVMAAADQVLTAGVSVIVGYGGKMAQDWWSARRAQKQADKALRAVPCWPPTATSPAGMTGQCSTCASACATS